MFKSLLALAAAANACVTFHATKGYTPAEDCELSASLFDGVWNDGAAKVCSWCIPYDDSSDVPYYAGECEDGWAALVSKDWQSMTATPEGAAAVTFEYEGEWEREGIFPPVFVDRIRVSNC